MRLNPHDAALRTLDMDEAVQEATPLSRASAIAFLSMFTGQSFGEDADAWRRWFAENSSKEYLDECYRRIEETARDLRSHSN
jgi:hypothetical protein